MLIPSLSGTRFEREWNGTIDATHDIINSLTNSYKQKYSHDSLSNSFLANINFNLILNDFLNFANHNNNHVNNNFNNINKYSNNFYNHNVENYYKDNNNDKIDNREPIVCASISAAYWDNSYIRLRLE